jgi:hypothetical protein
MGIRAVSREMLVAVARAKPAATSVNRQGQVREIYGQRRFDLATWIEEHKVPVKREGEWSNGGYRYILEECPWNGHTDNAAYVVQLANGAIAAGCHHNSCQQYGWRELREHYEPGYENNFKLTTDNLSAALKAGVEAERKLRFVTAKEVATSTSNKAEAVVDGYVFKGTITDVNGKPKASGKTTFVTHLCRKVLDGEPFMGLPTAKTGVVYLTEQSAATFREALARAGLLDREDFVVLFWRDTLGLDWPQVMNQAVEEALRRDAGLLVIDTLPQFAGLEGDGENSATAALEAMRPVQEAAAAHDLAVVMARHERKSGGHVGDSGRGSSAFTGAVDIILSIRRPEGNARPTIREIHALSRFDETPDVLGVELCEDGYKALGDSAAVAESEAREAILEAAPTSEAAAVNLTMLLMVTGLGRTTAQKAIEALLEAGKLRQVGEGVKGSPYRYWRPTSPEDPPNDPTIQDGQMRSAATDTLEEAERKTDAAGERSQSKTDDPFTADLSDTQEGSSSARSHDGDGETEMPENNCEASEEDHFSPGYYAVTKTIMVRGKEIRVYGAERASRSPGTKLAELGWTRNEKAARGRKRGPVDSSGAGGLDVNQDPVACSIRIALGSRFNGVAAVTAGDVWGWEGSWKPPIDLLSEGWPKNSKAMQKHLKQLSPALRATKHTYRFRDDDGVRRGDPFATKTWEGHMDVQYWEKAGGEVEGVWVFAAELAAPDDPQSVKRCVWERVKRLERIVEDDSD